MMMRVDAIIREERFENVKAALVAQNVSGATVSEVMGFGAQLGYTEVVRGTEVPVQLRRKIKIEIVVASEEEAQEIAALIQRTAHCGRIGDGKIFISPVSQAIRIRSGETGSSALAHAPEETTEETTEETIEETAGETVVKAAEANLSA